MESNNITEMSTLVDEGQPRSISNGQGLVRQCLRYITSNMAITKEEAMGLAYYMSKQRYALKGQLYVLTRNDMMSFTVPGGFTNVIDLCMKMGLIDSKHSPLEWITFLTIILVSIERDYIINRFFYQLEFEL